LKSDEFALKRYTAKQAEMERKRKDILWYKATKYTYLTTNNCFVDLFAIFCHTLLFLLLPLKLDNVLASSISFDLIIIPALLSACWILINTLLLPLFKTLLRRNTTVWSPNSWEFEYGTLPFEGMCAVLRKAGFYGIFYPSTVLMILLVVLLDTLLYVTTRFPISLYYVLIPFGIVWGFVIFVIVINWSRIRCSDALEISSLILNASFILLGIILSLLALQNLIWPYILLILIILSLLFNVVTLVGIFLLCSNRDKTFLVRFNPVGMVSLFIPLFSFLKCVIPHFPYSPISSSMLIYLGWVTVEYLRIVKQRTPLVENFLKNNNNPYSYHSIKF
jgi:hypothetical protein